MIVAMVCVDMATGVWAQFQRAACLSIQSGHQNYAKQYFLFKQRYENWAQLNAHFTNTPISIKHLSILRSSSTLFHTSLNMIIV